MCGTVIDGLGVKKQLGGLLAFGNSQKGKWSGFAREESLDSWIAGGWQETVVHAAGFTEGRESVFFEIPENHGIKAVFHPEKFIFPGAHPLNLVTRQATIEEMKIHPRMPRLVKK